MLVKVDWFGQRFQRRGAVQGANASSKNGASKVEPAPVRVARWPLAPKLAVDMLHEAGLLDRDKRGVWVYYGARTEALASLGALIGDPPSRPGLT